MSQKKTYGKISNAPVASVRISEIRQDGETQHRTKLDPATVASYAELMRGGTLFPPVRVWCDGSTHWLVDGFHRVAAAKSIGRTEVLAEVRAGTLDAARWDSYSSNWCHGLRWTPDEAHRVLALAFAHPNASRLSNIQLAKHLHLSESTVRRWRARNLKGELRKVRTVTRGGTTYMMVVERIGVHARPRHGKSRADLQEELVIMKEQASPRARRVLTILDKWLFGPAGPTECMRAIDEVIEQ